MSTALDEEQLQQPTFINKLVPRIGRIATISLGKYGALIVLALLVVLFALASPYYLTPTNVLEILNAAALSGIISCGLTIILVSGLFDLSLGYLASCSGILITHLMGLGVSWPLAVLIGIASGVLTGLVNGFLVTRWHINALVATLGTGSCLVGINYVISGGAPQDVSFRDPQARLLPCRHRGHSLGDPQQDGLWKKHPGVRWQC